MASASYGHKLLSGVLGQARTRFPLAPEQSAKIHFDMFEATTTTDWISAGSQAVASACALYAAGMAYKKSP